MKLREVISALSNATAENPLGDDSLLPYWDFFWAEDEKANISSQDKIRIFLLHLYFHYFNDKAEDSAIFVNLDWPDWMLRVARRYTRDATRLYHVRDTTNVSEIISRDALRAFGGFTEARIWGRNIIEAGSTKQRSNASKLPDAAAQLTVFPCPALGDFGARIDVSTTNSNGTNKNPYLWSIKPYGLMVSLIE